MIDILERGSVEVRGRMPWSSNATFLASVCLGDAATDAVYKPLKGERSLWDFPRGLYLREVAAYQLSEALGWGIVPETVVRDDAPFGVGSLQRFVPADFAQHYFTLLEDERHHDALRRIAVFDLLANNADRKSGHCLLGDDGRIWAIDHGVCFSDEPGKVRTVIWDFAGDAVAPDQLADIGRFLHDPPSFEGVLSSDERDALLERAERVVSRGRLPHPGAGRPYPWPLV